MIKSVSKIFIMFLAVCSFWVYANEDTDNIINPIKSIEKQLVHNVSDDEKFNELFKEYITYYQDLDSVNASYAFLQKLYRNAPFEWVKGAEIYTSTQALTKVLGQHKSLEGDNEVAGRELATLSDLRLSQPNSVTLRNIESSLKQYEGAKSRVKRSSTRTCGRSCHGGTGGSTFAGGGGGGTGFNSGFNSKSVAFNLGFNKRIPPQKSPFNSHGQSVFSNGKKYISLDVDGHNVANGWKMFDLKGRRIGTWSSDLSTRIKD
ncbi:toxin C-terminal domain-containing protein [Psychromonas sp. Urea-02u-13]|uniref:toxin C-terminal domain-containing protein n=1 Tax=Psychromonas sp. Urea-02u-13 TaxID=2058326 RepID=UPI0012FF2DCA|nr:toxin C-terminal domain-containing protein [Psychromonas sp. Urea-02u-13]